MGRPRKQPRRIVTFNLNLPLAEAIDDLPVKNRSEWMNDNLPTLLENRDATQALKRGGEAALEAIPDDLLFETADAQGIMDTFSTARLLNVLINRLEPLYRPPKTGLRVSLSDALTGALLDLQFDESAKVEK